MGFVINALSPRLFEPLFRLTPDEFQSRGIHAVVADNENYPCRISLRHASIGERLLLLNYEHQPAASPYRSAHAIYIAEGSNEPGWFRDTIPPIMIPRPLSVRAFDAGHCICDAEVVEGRDAMSVLVQMLSVEHVSYLPIHFAKRGCFAATARRTIEEGCGHMSSQGRER